MDEIIIIDNYFRPGEPCEGEAKDIYRRGARRWRRLYKINGHSFAARRFGKRALCIICRDVIWGLGRQGFRCIQCKMMVHKKCHKRVAIACGESYEHVTRLVMEVNCENVFCSLLFFNHSFHFWA